MSNDNLKRPNNHVVTLIPHHEHGTNGANNQDDRDKKDSKEDKSTAKALIELAVRHCEFFHDERDDGYAIVSDNDIQLTLGCAVRYSAAGLQGLSTKPLSGRQTARHCQPRCQFLRQRRHTTIPNWNYPTASPCGMVPSTSTSQTNAGGR
jgi:hypothetical protein